MKTLVATSLIFFTVALLADPVWQYVPDLDNIEGILPTEAGLVALDSRGVVYQTTDGENWEEAIRLVDPDDPSSIQKILQLDAGLAVMAKGSTHVEGVVQSERWYRLYTTTNGLDWDVAIETRDQGGVFAPALSEPYAYAGGWVVYSIGEAPAVIWQSGDGLSWTEVYFEEGASFERTGASAGYLHLLLRDAETSRWIYSEDGLSWSKSNSDSPAMIIEADGIYVGHNHSPGASGILYYSQDGQYWEVVGNPTGSRIGQRLFYTAGMFFFIQNRIHIHVSTNGYDWNLAAFPDGAIMDAIKPKVLSVYHDERGFWYQVSDPPPPVGMEASTHSDYFYSVDGLSWEVADEAAFPVESLDPVLTPVNNPNYTPPPGPVGNPTHLDPWNEKEIQMETWSLKAEKLLDARPGQVALYIKNGAAPYEVVNSSFGSHNASYPYADPVNIAASNGRFFVLNDTGRIGVLDLNQNHLAQPVNFEAGLGLYDDHIQLSWEPVPGAAAYRILRSLSDDPDSAIELAVVEETEFTDRIDLEINQLYSYQVQSLNGDQYSWLSDTREGRLWSIELDSALFIPDVDYHWGSGDPDAWADYYIGANNPSADLINARSTHYPWIWTVSHGWQYCCQSPGSLWLWDADLGWLWTRLQYYPNLFVATEKQWVYFLLKGEDSRWFYKYSDGSYLQVE